MKYLVIYGEKLLKSGRQTGNDDRNLNVFFRRRLLLWSDLCHLPQRPELCFCLCRTQSDTVCLTLTDRQQNSGHRGNKQTEWCNT